MLESLVGLGRSDFSCGGALCVRGTTGVLWGIIRVYPGTELQLVLLLVHTKPH